MLSYPDGRAVPFRSPRQFTEWTLRNGVGINIDWKLRGGEVSVGETRPGSEGTPWRFEISGEPAISLHPGSP